MIDGVTNNWKLINTAITNSNAKTATAHTLAVPVPRMDKRG